MPSTTSTSRTSASSSCVPPAELVSRTGILIGMLTRMTVEPMTTIKVPKDLRVRIAREAAEQGVTAARLISGLLDEHERRARFRAVGRAYATVDSGYAAETEHWDTLAGDGLE